MDRQRSVQSAESYQKVLEDQQLLDTIRGISRGIKQANRGEARPMRALGRRNKYSRTPDPPEVNPYRIIVTPDYPAVHLSEAATRTKPLARRTSRGVKGEALR